MSERDALLTQGYQSVARRSELPTVLPKRLTVGHRSILLCRDEGTDAVYAVDELCPHKQESMAFGVVHDGKIICPHHQYSFDLETGRSSMRRCPALEVYAVRVMDDEVFVKVPL